MKSIVKVVSLVVLILVSSCKEEAPDEVKAFDAQMKETIKIHDEVMPKMSSINSMISKLEAEKEELQQADEVNSEEVDLYDMAIANLKEAHDLMMSWMKSFSNTFSRTEINEGLATTDKDSIEVKLKHLELQYTSAEEMREAVNQAIENAQVLLAK